jgi:EAL domain-containing protein (putative c-di-GMP-specific phosphodiesterase class I)
MSDQKKLMRAALCKILSDDRDAYRALNESQFVPFFQPLVTLRSGQLAGFEVLARWQHPVAGLIPPNQFI